MGVIFESCQQRSAVAVETGQCALVAAQLIPVASEFSYRAKPIL